MKNLIIFIIMAIAIPSFGQTKSIKRFYNKYKHEEHVTNLNLQGWVLKMVATFTDDEDMPKELIRKISHLRILTFEGGNAVTDREYKNLLSDIRKEHFETVITVRDGKEKFHLLIREDDEIITDAVLFVNSPDEFVLLSLEGAFSLKDLKHLNLEIDEADHFEHVKGAL